MNKHFTTEECVEMARLIDEEHMTIGEVARRYDTSMNNVRKRIENHRKQSKDDGQQPVSPADGITDELIDRILRDKNNHLSKAYIAKRQNVTLETVEYVMNTYKDRYAEMFSKPKPQPEMETKPEPEPKPQPKEEKPATKDPQDLLREIAHYYNQGATWEELNGMFGLNNNSLSKLIKDAKAQGLVDTTARRAGAKEKKQAPEESRQPVATEPIEEAKPQAAVMEQPKTAPATEAKPEQEAFDMDAVSSNELFRELQRRGYRLEGGKIYQKKTVKVDLEPIVNNGQYLRPVNTSLMSPAYTNEDLIFELHRRGFRIQDNSLYQITDIEVDLHKMVHPE